MNTAKIFVSIESDALDSYRPQEVLVSDQQPHDIGGASGHGVLLLLRDLRAKALEHEDVRCHDYGDVVEAHFVLGLVVDHTLEKLQYDLRERKEKMKPRQNV